MLNPSPYLEILQSALGNGLDAILILLVHPLNFLQKEHFALGEQLGYLVD